MNTISIKVSGLSLCVILASGTAQSEVAKEAWVARYNGPGNSKDNTQALAVDAAGNACVTGFSDGGDGNYDFATVKYDGSGNQAWVARYDGESHGRDAWLRGGRAVCRKSQTPPISRRFPAHPDRNQLYTSRSLASVLSVRHSFTADSDPMALPWKNNA